MANTIKNFLVGVGLDASKFDEGERDVTSGLGRIQAVAGFAGAAMIGAFASASSAAIAAGNRIDEFNLSTEKLSSSPKFIYDYGNALQSLGGDADEAIAAVTSVETALDNLKLKGDAGVFNDAAFAGVDTSMLTQARDGEEFLRMLANMVPELNKDQQRLLQNSFGFSDATMRSLRQGQQEFDALIDHVSGLTGNIQDSTEAAREFNQQLDFFQLRLEGLSNTMAEKLLPAFADTLSEINGFIDNNKSAIDKTLELAFSSPFGGSLATGGIVGSAVRGGMAGYDWLTESSGDWIKEQRSEAIERSSAYRQSVMDGAVDNQDAIRATPDYNFYNSRSDTNNYQQPKIENKLDVNLTIDGKALESTITGVVERRDQATIDDMQSTTAR